MKRSYVALITWITSLVLVGLWVIVRVLGGRISYPYWVPMFGIGLLFSTFGFLIVRRRPDNRVARLFPALGLAGSALPGSWRPPSP